MPLWAIEEYDGVDRPILLHPYTVPTRIIPRNCLSPYPQSARIHQKSDRIFSLKIN
ncbi:MAG: hypothetical protein J7647_30240 [Cyanobacteria bacterium SBLK]|nr:hypothetical protein [Cyanobacteria bacterium SBLK]